MVDPVFPALAADDVNSEPTELESLCVQCGENGVTRLMLTKIPHYREILIMSFSCQQCGFSNNEIQPGGKIQEQGIRYSVTVSRERDLSRQVVKSDYATLTIPEIELEIPPLSQKGEISTVEGVLQRTVSGLEQDQPVRRVLDPDSAERIDQFLAKMRRCLNLETGFTVVLEDPSGNSFIENPSAPAADPGRTVSYYQRTKEQNHALCLYSSEELECSEDPVLLKTEGEVQVEDRQEKDEEAAGESLGEEVLRFPTNCPDCNAPCSTNMKITQIPFFKEVVIMATICEACGHKTNEVKSGGGIEERGRKIILQVTDPSDLCRDILKSETCDILIPDLEFEMGGAALGGRFTTLEGLLVNVKEQVETNPLWGAGDGVAPDVREKMDQFRQKLEELIQGGKIFTFILDDPAGNSYLQNVYAPDEDPEMKIELYERSFEQNESLGLNDMKVENYEDDWKKENNHLETVEEESSHR